MSHCPNGHDPVSLMNGYSRWFWKPVHWMLRLFGVHKEEIVAIAVKKHRDLCNWRHPKHYCLCEWCMEDRNADY